jgi:mono/diheme cytochrome c family protein
MRIKILVFLLTTTFALGLIVSIWSSTAVSQGGQPFLSAADLTGTACAPATEYFGYLLYGSPTPTPIPLDAEPTATFVGSAANGETLFHSVAACNACHSTTNENWMVGPPLKGIGERAISKAHTKNARDYLRAVILNPDENIMPQAMPGIMPRSYRYTLTAEQIEDIIAYLLSL